MPFYQDIDSSTAEGARTLDRLLALRAQLAAEIPERTQKRSLLLATWNIRDFDKPTFGERLEESIYYIAEIISHFDLVAVQEVYRDLRGLNRVLRVLGSHWDYLFTDATEGARGNDERMLFLFDSRKVKFGGLAGELVLPPVRGKSGQKVPASQFSRSPYVCGFQAGWTKFMLSTVHILWGGGASELEERVDEIRQVAGFLRDRTEDETAWARNLILLGDFNIFSPEDATFAAITDAGFVVPDELQNLPSNATRVRHYDQIAFRVRENALEMTGNAGVFDYYQTLFRDSDEDKEIYHDLMMPGLETKSNGKPRSERSKKNYFKTYWRTHQMSDHLPMWVELRIDYSNEYLQRRLESVRSRAAERPSHSPTS